MKTLKWMVGQSCEIFVETLWTGSRGEDRKPIDRPAQISNCIIYQQAGGEEQVCFSYCSFAYSDLASFRMGMSGSASFQRVRKS
jgi:hypothetical protein